MQILVVADDRDLTDLLVFALARAGFASAVAADRAGLLRQLDHNPPDLVVLDLDLSSHHGLDLLRDLRQRSRLPVILLSSRTRADDQGRGLELGAVDALIKPLRFRDLIARIQAHLTPQQPALARRST